MHDIESTPLQPVLETAREDYQKKKETATINPDSCLGARYELMS
jgi:hypothetical protein